MSRINAISKPVVIDLELWQIKALQELAEENGCGVNELINRIVREWLEGQADYQPETESQMALF